MRTHDVCPDADRQQPKGYNDGQRYFLFATSQDAGFTAQEGSVLSCQNLPAREGCPVLNRA
jgi:hypothetical protein